MEWLIRAIGIYLLIVAGLRAAVAVIGKARPQYVGWLWAMTAFYGAAGLGLVTYPTATACVLFPVLIVFTVIDQFIMRQRWWVRERVRTTERLIEILEAGGKHIEAKGYRNELEMFRKSFWYRVWSGSGKTRSSDAPDSDSAA